MLVQYLQDIVDLETQKRIAGNTYNRILVMEKDYAYVKNVSSEEEIRTSGVIKKIKWLRLLGKLYLGFLVEAIAALLLKWTIIFTIGLSLEISSKAIEIFP